MVRCRILVNANFVTDGVRPPQAVAVGYEKILAVGDLSDVRDTVGSNTDMIDLAGATVFPGFADSHVHVLNFGRSRMGVPCWPSDVASTQEIVERVRSVDRREPQGRWMRGRGYDPSQLAERRAPTATELDLKSGRCVVLDSFDFHGRVANHAALAAAGIGPDTPDPPNGEIVRDEHGAATGELVDGARVLLDAVMPPWSKQEDEQAIEIATDYFLSLGFTYVTNAAPLTMSHQGEEVAAFLRLSERGALRLRFTSMIRAELVEKAADLGLRPGIGDNNFRLGGAKVFGDGAFGPRTAFLSSAYSDGETTGSMRIDSEDLELLMRRGSETGWQMCVHAIGDEAVATVARLMEDHPPIDTPRPHRIEHCSLTSNETIRVMARAGIVPVPQLGFLRYRAEDLLSALGEDRLSRLYPLRTWIDSGLRPIHSSDSPVIADARPLAAAATGIGRMDSSGRVWGPEEAVTFDEIIAMLTQWPAAADGLGSIRGRIATGFLADFTVFEDDPRSASPEALAEMTPVQTIVGGQTAWEAG